MAAMSPLRRRMIEDMTIRNLSHSTQQSYIYAVAKFSRHFNCRTGSARHGGCPCLPAQSDRPEVLVVARQSGGVRIAVLLGITLGQKEAFERIVAGKEPQKLPPVLSPEEMVRFLEAVKRKAQACCADDGLCGGFAGVRSRALKISAIDSRRMVLRIERGKGGKDRYAMLWLRLLHILRAYWKRARPSSWLFPGQEPGGHVSRGALQSACRFARQRARIGKRVAAHSLRHSFAHPSAHSVSRSNACGTE